LNDIRVKVSLKSQASFILATSKLQLLKKKKIEIYLYYIFITQFVKLLLSREHSYILGKHICLHNLHVALSLSCIQNVPSRSDKCDNFCSIQNFVVFQIIVLFTRSNKRIYLSNFNYKKIKIKTTKNFVLSILF